MKKDIFAEERKRYKIVNVDSHHGHRAVIMVKKNLGTNPRQTKTSKVSRVSFGGNSRRD